MLHANDELVLDVDELAVKATSEGVEERLLQGSEHASLPVWSQIEAGNRHLELPLALFTGSTALKFVLSKLQSVARVLGTILLRANLAPVLDVSLHVSIAHQLHLEGRDILFARGIIAENTARSYLAGVILILLEENLGVAWGGAGTAAATNLSVELVCGVDEQITILQLRSHHVQGRLGVERRQNSPIIAPVLLILGQELGNEAIFDTSSSALPQDTTGHAGRKPVWQREAEGERVLTRRKLALVQRERDVNNGHEAGMIAVVVLGFLSSALMAVRVGHLLFDPLLMLFADEGALVTFQRKSEALMVPQFLL